MDSGGLGVASYGNEMAMRRGYGHVFRATVSVEIWVSTRDGNRIRVRVGLELGL